MSAFCPMCYEQCARGQVARCTKIIKPGTEEAKYVINVKQIAKVSPSYTCFLLRKASTGKQCTPQDPVHLAEHFVVRTQFVVGLGDRVAPTDIEEGMRVG